MFTLTIGNFAISESYASVPDKISIARVGDDPSAGEGGEFSLTSFEAAVRAFYEEHF